MNAILAKQCSRCLQTKALNLFRRNPRMRLGADSWCKSCVSEHKSKRRQEVILVSKPQIAAKRCGGCNTTLVASQFSVERGRADGLSRICRECRSAKHRAHYQKDPAAWRAKAVAANAKRSENPEFIVHKRISARVGEWLGTRKGGKRCFDLLGFTLPELRLHLERQFLKGMSWENMGEWHIDHIVPLSSFRISGPDDPEVRRAWALTNLRPLWAQDNIKKGAKAAFLI